MISLKMDKLDKVTKTFEDMLRRCQDTTPVQKIIADKGRNDVIDHFEETKGPKSKWERLKNPRKNGTSKPLNDTGRLKGSINIKALKKEAHVFTNMKYAAIHNFGGKAGRGKKVTIPQREFMWISKSARESMITTLVRFITKRD